MRQTAFVAAVLFGLAMPVHAATFTVTSDADSGPATLRWAIEQANATPGRDSINFSPSNLDRTISLVSPLPAITDPLDFPETFYYYRVTIDGSAAGPGTNGLMIAAAHCFIVGIIVQNFSGDGVVVLGNDNFVTVGAAHNQNGIRVFGDRNAIATGYYFGSPADFVFANRAHGIWVTPDASDNQIGPRLGGIRIPEDRTTWVTITENAGAGILIEGDRTIVRGVDVRRNRVGLEIKSNNNIVSDEWGATVYGSTGHGIDVAGNDNTLDHVLTIGNTGDGIRITGAGNALEGTTEASLNGGSGLSFQTNVLFQEMNYGACNTGALVTTNSGIAPPVLTAATLYEGVIEVKGTFHDLPNRTYRLDFVGSGEDCAAPPIIGPQFIPMFVGFFGDPSASIQTGASGSASFSALVSPPFSEPPPNRLVAIATRLGPDGEPNDGTSSVSAPVAVIQTTASTQADLRLTFVAPPTAFSGETIEILYTVTNAGPAPSRGTSISAYFPYWYWYASVDPLYAGESRTLRWRVKVSGQPGSTFLIAAEVGPIAGEPVTTDNSVNIAIGVTAPQQVPALSPAMIVALIAMLAVVAAVRLRN